MTPQRTGDGRAISRMVAAAVVLAVVVVAGGAAVLLTQSNSSTSATHTGTTSSTTSSIPSSSSSTIAHSLSSGSVVIVPANYNFTVAPKSCKYFNFTDPSFYGNFTGSFTANPSIVMYLFNDTSYSLAQNSGESIVQYTFATVGNFNVTLAVSSFQWNAAIPQARYHLAFCDWTAVPDVVTTDSTAITASWPY